MDARSSAAVPDSVSVSSGADAIGHGTNSWAALVAMLCGTFLGTLNNNIVNVPLRDISQGYGVAPSQGVLVVVSFLLVFAVTMPLTGWLGDRLGRRRVFSWSMVGLVFGAIGAATAPSLAVLVAFRAIQGLATAAVLPTVMGLIADIFTTDRRARALGYWAAVNGIGQAVGPPVGGLIAAWVGWRWIFAPIVPGALLVLLATMRYVPRDPARSIPLDWRGASSLTSGSALLIAAATMVAMPEVPRGYPVALAAAGVVLLVLFAWSATHRPNPFIAGRLIVESRFLRSCLAVFAQMFCLGTTLVAVPLYLTGEVGATTAVAGLVVFAFPAAMAVLAPVSGLLTERHGPRWVVRGGLLTLVAGQLLLGWYLAASGAAVWVVAALMLLGGVGVGLVQTPVATSATRAPAGRSGAALGLFNLIRFSGSALGAAWVALVIPSNALLALFVVSAAVAVIGLVGTYAGDDPAP
ncbi:MAG TPA: MFS transporter [Candidatus Nanopelagicales bacterium]|jgi:MFS family permease